MTTDQGAPMRGVQMMRLPYAGRCGCGEPLAAGERAGYESAAQQLLCLVCLAARQADFAHLIEAARLPGNALTPDSSGPDGPGGDETLGPEGQERVATALAAVAAYTLPQRRVPGTRDPIEHLAVAASGVYVVGTKWYPDAEIWVDRVGGLSSPRRTELRVGGRLRNHLAARVAAQAESVRHLIAAAGLTDMPVTPVLCLVDAAMSAPVGRHRVEGAAITTTAGLQRLVDQAGPLDDVTRRAVARLLGTVLRETV